MRRIDGRIVYSPTDLVIFLRSPFASWMDRLRLERPGAAAPDEDDAQSEMLSRRGDEHEAAVLARLRAEGRSIVSVTRDRHAVAATKEALASGTDVVYQAALADDDFTGYADFLVRDAAGGWAVWDAKLSRSAKPHHVVQLCCYADLLRHAAGAPASTIALVLGNGDVATFRTADFHWYYLGARRAFLDLMDRFDPEAAPPDPEPGADHGRWSSAAESWFEERDHLVRVAGMRSSQIARLADVGITRMAQLAESRRDAVAGIGRDVLLRLVRQARLQVASRGKSPPEFEILRPSDASPRAGLALLPPASPGDVHLDLEGFPLVDDGLEYLFGVIAVEDGAPQFRDWWAHDAAGEKKAFQAVVDFITERRRRDRAMHVYHYGAYEVTALRRLMGKYGTREDEVDGLLRGGVFVDLLPVVRQGLALGESAYSLKNVERLWRAPRAGEVQDAAASMVEYDRWIESGEPPDWRESPILAGIRAYNEVDCSSTWRLAEWLRERQRLDQIAYLAPETAASDDEPERPVGPETQARRDLCVQMLAEAEAMTGADVESRERWRIHELLAHLVEFHRREEKPQWWALFDRADRSHEELAADVDCLGDLALAGKPSPAKRSMTVAFDFDADQETKIDADDDVRLSHAIDVTAKVVEIDRERGRVVLKFGPTAWTALGSTAPERVSLIPFTIVNAGAIQDAIVATATDWREGRGMPRALEDFLRRCPPRVRGHAGGPLIRDGEDRLAGATRVVTDLDESCLVIQGPPGSGKTYTAAHVIAALLKCGKNVGITSNSHKAIENLLAACDRAAGGGLRMLKVGGDAESPLLADCAGARFCKDSGKARDAYGGGLVGGTAWLFAREDWRGALDYLFVDEAGQVSLANLVGVAASAKNLVLLGDQMQLSQPTQGTHPGESGLSLLDYYLEGRATIPDELGLFLSRTWRLHPAICGFISDSVYERRLLPESGTTARTIELPASGAVLVRRDAGIVFVPVEHQGNSQASDEEVDAIRRVVAELSGRRFTDPESPRAIGLGDVLFVAPYNMQVRRLRAALGDSARVGSVDKFQGQEAPVVVLSMCASAGEFGPRGSAFLLDIHRLNVAISRAKSLAIVVGDPRLARAPARSIEEMRRLNLLCRLVAEGCVA